MGDLLVAICDDDPTLVTEWSEKMTHAAEAAGTALKVDTFTGERLSNTFQALDRRRAEAREKSPSPPDCELDNYDIVVVDYDLIGLKPIETGESLAYLARCYSDCAYIVGLNAFQGDFDLTLTAHLDSFSDLNIRSGQLVEVGLWHGRSSDGAFTPWSWPVLSREPHRMRALVAEVATNLDAKVLDAVGMNTEFDLGRLTEAQLEFLSPDDPCEATFRTFANVSGSGFRESDRPLNDEGIARVAVARLVKWIETSVAPGQEVVIDVPHLPGPYPSLVANQTVEQLNEWKSRGEVPPWAADLGGRAAASAWHSRPRWSMAALATLELPENIAPWSVPQRSDLVFCEDTSTFEPAGKVFRADVPGVRSRYINGLGGIDYRPTSRLVS